jgi:hypothetical protein
MKLIYITTPLAWLCLNLIISIIAFTSATGYDRYYFASLMEACAAANLAIGTLKGEQLT